MGSEQGGTWEPRSRVGAVVVALVRGDQAAAERAAERPPDEHDPEVLSAAIRLAVHSLFDEDTEPDGIAEFVAAMGQDVEVDRAVAVALIRAQLGEPQLLDAFPAPGGERRDLVDAGLPVRAPAGTGGLGAAGAVCRGAGPEPGLTAAGRPGPTGARRLRANSLQCVGSLPHAHPPR